MRLTYRDKDFRGVIVHTAASDSEPTGSANGRLSFEITLKAGHSWRRRLTYDLVDRVERVRAPRESATASATSGHARKMEGGGASVKIQSSNEEFYSML